MAQKSYALFVALFILIPSPVITEGGIAWVGLGLFFYLFRSNRAWQIIGLVTLATLSCLGNEGFQWMMLFAALPIWLYNGNSGKKGKYFFYLFYPGHIYILYVASYLAHNL